MKPPLIALIASVLLVVVTAVASPLPDPAQLRADDHRLAALEHSFTGEFDRQFWRASIRVARQRGPDILHAVMFRSRKWQGEEGLIFVPLVAMLPRAPALEIIHRYQRSRRESDRVWAGEFITEFNMSDTSRAVQEYSKKK